MQTPDATGTAPTIAETLAKLGADDKTGLTDADVQARLRSTGQTRWWKNRKTVRRVARLFLGADSHG
jgi:hypothetical protein